MARLIKLDLKNEGDLFNKWLKSRLITNNKNVLSVELGPTGSGKSYRDLRKAELWYKYHFKEEFPVENICFGVLDIMQRLSKGKLRRGEILIFEEAGANLGSLDFQNKVAKMFNYVLQSFRSMNIAIFFNLPYLSMLNKTARILLHYSGESNGIDFQTKVSKSKPMFHQVNQGTGKIYKKYPRAKILGVKRKIKTLNYAMPSKYLIDAYELKKANYLKETTKEYAEQLNVLKNGREVQRIPREIEFEAYNRYRGGEKQHEIAESLGKTQQLISSWVKTVENYRNLVKSRQNKGIFIEDIENTNNQPQLTPV